MDEQSLVSIISKNRVKTLKDKGLICKTSYQDKTISKQKNQTAYRLTKKGKTFCQSKGMNHFEKSKGCERHQVALAKEYAKLTPQEQMSCQNQYDQRQQYNLENDFEKNNNISAPSYIDMIYISSSNEIIGIEIITSNYSQQEIIEHHHTATTILHCAVYTEIKI